ncbi:DEAD/DEAH box helicase family protein [Streptomyces sp. NPDC047085]|uniref:DEAD/DEAH box helicase family protein n=1 Tax=Streptomyces sp. NPDC047085 TaxID=3155140 RepID=UPI0033FC771A
MPLATPHPAARRVLRPDQNAAVDAAVRHLRNPGSRGHIVSACGTGKTLIALCTADALDARHLLVAVPSLGPLGQWAAAARADGRRERLMAVSSFDAGKHPLLAGAGAVSTRSGEYLAYWLAQRTKRREQATVFVTLESLPCTTAGPARPGRHDQTKPGGTTKATLRPGSVPSGRLPASVRRIRESGGPRRSPGRGGSWPVRVLPCGRLPRR